MTYPTLFGTGGHACLSQTFTPGTGYYGNVGLGRSPMQLGGFTNAASVSQIIRAPGTFAYLSWGVDAPFPAALTLNLNKNGAATTLAVSIPSETTGIFTDSTDSITVASGDSLDFAASTDLATSGTYTGSFSAVLAKFTNTSQSVQIITTVGPASISAAGTQYFINFLGVMDVIGPTESFTQLQSPAAGTWKNMACHVASNIFSGSTTPINRKNGTSGSMAISVPGCMSGYFEDTTHSDSVLANDLLNYSITASDDATSTTGTLTLDWIGAHFLGSTTSPISHCLIGGSEGSQFPISGGPQGTNYYSSLFGGGAIDTDIARATGVVSYGPTASEFTNFLTASGVASTFTFLQNGSPSALAVSAGAGQTGHLTDNTHTVSVAAGDTIADQVFVAQDGDVIWANASLLLNGS